MLLPPLSIHCTVLHSASDTVWYMEKPGLSIPHVFIYRGRLSGFSSCFYGVIYRRIFIPTRLIRCRKAECIMDCDISPASRNHIVVSNMKVAIYLTRLIHRLTSKLRRKLVRFHLGIIRMHTFTPPRQYADYGTVPTPPIYGLPRPPSAYHGYAV